MLSTSEEVGGYEADGVGERTGEMSPPSLPRGGSSGSGSEGRRGGRDGTRRRGSGERTASGSVFPNALSA